MRILFLATRDWHPCDSGGRLRNYHLAKALSLGNHVTWVGFSDGRSTDGAGQAPMSAIPFMEPPAQEFIMLPVERRYTPRKISAGVLGPDPLPVLNYRSAAMSQAIVRLLAREHYQVVHLAALPLADYIPVVRAAGRPVVVSCDWHNVDSDLMLRYSRSAPGPFHRAYAARTAQLLHNFERRILAECDVHTAVSDLDRNRLHCMAPKACIYRVDNGVDVSFYAPENGSERSVEDTTSRKRVLFVGSMDYAPNEFAVLEFATQLWPVVLHRHPELVFTVVGRDPSAAVRALARRKGIEVSGTVPDVRPYYRQALASIAPLRVGGGSRIKILEAMAAGVPVLATPVGAEGLDVRYGEHIAVAEHGANFLEDLLTLIDHPRTRGKIAGAASDLVRRRYDWKSIGSRLADIYSRRVEMLPRGGEQPVLLPEPRAEAVSQ